MKLQELSSLLRTACTGKASAMRAKVRLMPIDGAGGKVAPPTYVGAHNEPGQYASEMRVVNGSQDPVHSVLLDSVQAQSNRLEELLLVAFRNRQLNLPVFELKIPGHEDVTSLTAPHRVHDAIFRDSLWEGKPFRQSTNGQRLVAARAWNATAFFEYAPTSLLFGTWDSQSGGGVSSAKIARALVSEIIALHAIRGVRTSSRLDPLSIKILAKPVYKSADPSEMWTLDAKQAEKGKKDEPKLFGKGKPSEINHGNIAPTITDRETGPGGITFREAIQTTVLSFAQLRKLRFPDGQASSERDVAGRAVLAALGLYAIMLQWEDGYQLRSRCHLIPVESPRLELIGPTASDVQPFELDVETARSALESARQHAESLGLHWHSGSIQLQPSPKLLEIVKLSDQSTEEPEG